MLVAGWANSDRTQICYYETGGIPDWKPALKISPLDKLLALGFKPLRYRGMAREVGPSGKEILTRAMRSSAISVPGSRCRRTLTGVRGAFFSEISFRRCSKTASHNARALKIILQVFSSAISSSNCARQYSSRSFTRFSCAQSGRLVIAPAFRQIRLRHIPALVIVAVFVPFVAEFLRALCNACRAGASARRV